MKRLSKFLVACLAIIPCAFTFTACGNQLTAQASVNIEGNYETATSDDFKKFAEDNKDVKSFVDGVRMTTITKMTINGKEYESVTNSIATIKNGKLTGLAILMETPAIDDEPATTTTIYYKDSTMYGKIVSGEKEETYQTELDIDTVAETYMAGMETDVLDEVLTLISEITTVEKATSGKTTKWHIQSGKAEDEEFLDYYIICKEGVVTGCQMTMKMSIMSISTETVLIMEEFSGSIKYPKDLADYSTELPSLF